MAGLKVSAKTSQKISIGTDTFRLKAEPLSEVSVSGLATLGAVTAVTGLAATYYFRNQPKPNCVPLVDLNDQSYELPDGSRCSKLTPKGELVTRPYDDVGTLYDVFQKGLSVSEKSPCLGQRTGRNLEYEWLTYRQVHDKAQAFGSWMIDHGCESGRDHIIGIFSNNRAEWVITEQACSIYNIISTALYETLGDEAIRFIVNQTKMSLVVCDSSEKVNKLLQFHSEMKSIQTIVMMNDITEQDNAAAEKQGVKLIAFQDALSYGEKNLKKPQIPKPEDVSFICYTSGTTGDPKGAVLTHANLVADLAGQCYNFKPYRQFNKDDVYISYLPLPHIYERFAQQNMLMHGARIGFFRGDVKLLLEDIRALKPTVFPGVPRLLNRLYDKIMLGVQKSFLKRKLLEWGIAAKKREVEQFILRKNGFWDKLIFNKIQALLGGRVDIISTGSAPLEAKILDFMRCAFGCFLLEGYGQTECAAAATTTVSGTFDAGHVGPPVPCNYVKLMDCEEEGYFSKDNKGEVCIKGGNVFQGYFKDPQKTAEVLDKDGWLHTGDVGEWLPNGTLKIIDRKKHMFKLSQGEYVAPEKIEILLVRSPFVAQVFVDGDSLQSFILAVIVPDEEVLIPWAKENNLPTTLKELCENETVKDKIFQDICRLGNEAGLKGFELVKDIILHAELFSVENSLLTPTFKNKRPYLRKYFKEQFAALYKKHQY